MHRNSDCDVRRPSFIPFENLDNAAASVLQTWWREYCLPRIQATRVIQGYWRYFRYSPHTAFCERVQLRFLEDNNMELDGEECDTTEQLIVVEACPV
jgi:hypothetical protein